MTRVRIVMLCTIVALILALVPAVAAQDETFGLSAEDYALLTAANANSQSAASFDYTFTLTVDASSSGDAMNVALEGSGSNAEGFSMDVSGTTTASGESTPLALSLVAAGDSLYLSTDNGETWYGSTLEELGAAGSSMMGGMLPVDPEALASGDLSDLEGQMGDMGGMVTGLEGLDPASFISMSSAPAADGTTEFTINLDLATLLNSPEMAQLLGTAMTGAMGTGTTTSATPSPDEITMMGQMFGSMFGTATASLVQNVDPATQHITGTTLNFSLPLDAMGEAGDGVNVVFHVDITNYDGATAVVAPSSFEPLSDLLSGLMGGLSGMSGM